jgi:type II secretory pathway pseudopilin PulG
MSTRPGFTLFECISVVALLSVGVALLQPVAGEARRTARMQQSQDNLRFWGEATGSYINDYGGLLPTYTWQSGQVVNMVGWNGQPVSVRTLPYDALVVLTIQETDLLRRRTGRAVGERKIRDYLVTIFPNRRRTHLVMADHMDLSVTSPRAADPQDRFQLVAQRDPLRFEDVGPYPQSTGGESPFQGGSPNNPIVQRWPYSSSYRVVPASYSQDQAVRGLATLGPHSSTSNLFHRGQLPYGGRRVDEVAFASQKVWMFEWHDRHSTDQGLWYAYPQARPNKLMFDGSVNDFATGDANEGFNPNDPANPEPFVYRYSPLTTEPAPVGDPDALYPVSFRWTRGGLAGIDYTP